MDCQLCCGNSLRCKVIQLVRCRAHQFGLAVASVVCFLAVLMAWYGVNFVLGKGLHSYGFGIGGETYVAIFVALDLLFVAFAIWRYRTSTSAAVAPREITAERAAV